MTDPKGPSERWFERFDAYSVRCPTCQAAPGLGCTGGFGGGYSIHSDRVYVAAQKGHEGSA